MCSNNAPNLFYNFTSGGHKVAPHSAVPRGTAWCIICIIWNGQLRSHLLRLTRIPRWSPRGRPVFLEIPWRPQRPGRAGRGTSGSSWRGTRSACRPQTTRPYQGWRWCPAGSCCPGGGWGGNKNQIHYGSVPNFGKMYFKAWMFQLVLWLLVHTQDGEKGTLLQF